MAKTGRPRTREQTKWPVVSFEVEPGAHKLLAALKASTFGSWRQMFAEAVEQRVEQAKAQAVNYAKASKE